MKIGPFGSALKKEFYTKSGYKVYAQENVFTENFFIGDYYIPKAKYEELSSCKLEPGDLVISMMGTIGSCAIFPENAEIGIMNSHLLRLQFKENIKTEYIYQLLKNSPQIRKQIKHLSVGSIMNGLSSSVVKKIIFPIPEFSEQCKIAKFFKLLDTRIHSQSKIIDNLESLKVGIWDAYYKNMSIFNSVKLSDVLKERKEYCLKNETYPHATLSKDGVSGKTDRYNRDFLVKDDEKEYKVTHLNDICYNPANLKFGVICRNNFGSAIFSPIYVTYEVNKKYNVNFIEQVLTSNSFIQYIRKYEQGTVYERMAVNSEDFLKGFIKIPSIEEQNKITQIINNINLKLQKEKDILELYKKQKAYLLKNMFI